ncbi:hypothetical protein [Halorubrum sp. HHNYT27]|uniref:hypothetical protein n=1 Tax=Halorubrum sp. HHNYT27 TaxID=3402275 RepID=UPI003EB8CEAD
MSAERDSEEEIEIAVDIDRSFAGEFLTRFRRHERIHALNRDARDALHRGGR